MTLNWNSRAIRLRLEAADCRGRLRSPPTRTVLHLLSGWPLAPEIRIFANKTFVLEVPRWLLHAGDAYFYRGEVRGPKRCCAPGLRAYQLLMNTHGKQQLANKERVQWLSVERRADVQVICSHDPVEFERCVNGNPL
jgi:hypothetical protein